MAATHSSSASPSCSSLFSHNPLQAHSASSIQTFSGSHRLKITEYSLIKRLSYKEYIMSPSFTVGGHDWAIQYYPSGDTSYGDIALYVMLQNKERDVIAFWDLRLEQQKPARTTPVISGTHKFTGWLCKHGDNNFIRRNKLEVDFVEDDAFTIICSITVLKPRMDDRVAVIQSSVVLPPNLHEQLGRLLETGVGSDVTFDVGGETFTAHKCVLAARSPIFEAQFYSSMSNNSMQRITIDNMEASVFKALLHFIYSDSLPEDWEAARTSTVMARHLLLAANRYKLERLTLMCEERLCEAVDAETL